MKTGINRLLPILLLAFLPLQIPAQSVAGGSLHLEEYTSSTGSPVKIVTNPDNADIYIDNIYFGKSPLEITSLFPGLHLLRIEKDSYRTYTTWFTLTEQTRLILTVDLELVTGFLSLSVLPNDAQITAGGTRLGIGTNELPVGRYNLVVKAFGYNPFETVIQIGDNQTTRMNIALELAEFEVTDFSIRRKRFNPDNPGVLGSCSIDFIVTSWGNGEVVLFDEASTVVWRREVGPFNTWDQSIIWRGVDLQGNPVKDGFYKVELSLSDGGREILLSEVLQVDRTRVISYRSLFEGNSGLYLAPSADTLPRESLQVSLNAFGTSTSEGTDLQVQGAARIPLTDRLELDPHFSVFPKTDASSLQVGIGIKALLVQAEQVSVASVLTGLVGTPVRGGGINLSGFLSILLPTQIKINQFYLLLAPELALDFLRKTWASARAGILYEKGPLGIGVSAKITSNDFSQPFGISLPLQAAAEINWLIPETQMVVSLLFSGLLNPAGDLLSGFTFGGGLGFLD